MTQKNLILWQSKQSIFILRLEEILICSIPLLIKQIHVGICYVNIIRPQFYWNIWLPWSSTMSTRGRGTGTTILGRQADAGRWRVADGKISSTPFFLLEQSKSQMWSGKNRAGGLKNWRSSTQIRKTKKFDLAWNSDSEIFSAVGCSKPYLPKIFEIAQKVIEGGVVTCSHVWDGSKFEKKLDSVLRRKRTPDGDWRRTVMDGGRKHFFESVCSKTNSNGRQNKFLKADEGGSTFRIWTQILTILSRYASSWLFISLILHAQSQRYQMDQFKTLEVDQNEAPFLVNGDTFFRWSSGPHSTGSIDSTTILTMHPSLLGRGVKSFSGLSLLFLS